MCIRLFPDHPVEIMSHKDLKLHFERCGTFVLPFDQGKRVIKGWRREVERSNQS